MDKDRMDKLAGNPRFIPGIFNYCDRWCERCAFTSRCLNYAMSQEEFGDLESQDIDNQAFWDKLHGIFAATLEMVKEKAQELGVDLNAIDREEAARQQELVHQRAKEQPCSKAAMKYVKMVDGWFKSNEGVLEDKSSELQTLAAAGIPSASPVDEAVSIHDCLEVIRWYQHQIYVKLCRAATGIIRGELEDLEDSPEDANGSAKVALIGIDRSTEAWAGLLPHFPDQEHEMLDLLATLQRLRRQVETAFPQARAFLRPGFDTDVPKLTD
jgi:hypothetical protein